MAKRRNGRNKERRLRRRERRWKDSEYKKDFFNLMYRMGCSKVKFYQSSVESFDQFMSTTWGGR